jgi:hypothetical protein
MYFKKFSRVFLSICQSLQPPRVEARESDLGGLKRKGGRLGGCFAYPSHAQTSIKIGDQRKNLKVERVLLYYSKRLV